MKFIVAHKWLLIILVIALFMRLVLLQSFPIGFHVDEVKVGWNAYSISQTGKDDLGNAFPLYYNTFGDYRPTGIFYITIPSIILFGLNHFAVRFPSAVMGALTIFPLFYFVKALSKKAKNAQAAALCSALVLAVSPWHVFVSRATSEAVISLFFALCGMCFYIYALKSHKVTLFVMCFISLVISMQFYHMVRPLIPLFLFVVLCYYWQQITHQSRKRGIIFFIAIVITSSFFLSSKSSLGRFKQVAVTHYETVLGAQKEELPLLTKIKDEYTKYVSMEFLTGESPKPVRYRVFGVGLINLAVFGFFVAGCVSIFTKQSSSLPLVLFLLSPIPAAVTSEDTPNLHRALCMLPFLAIIAGFGAVYLWQNGFFKRMLFFGLSGMFIITSILSFGLYVRSGSLDAAPVRNLNTELVVQKIISTQTSFDHIVITNSPDSVYPWYAFYKKLNPRQFNPIAAQRTLGEWEYENIHFTNDKCPSGDTANNKALKGKILIVDAPLCDTEGILKAHPTLSLEYVPFSLPREDQYHLWIRSE